MTLEFRVQHQFFPATLPDPYPFLYDNRKDFNDFVNSNTSFNPHNMFICKSKKILKDYYSTIFPWLERCEKLFGFDNLKGFGKIRIYTFLAERFMPYWFHKNAKIKTMPIIFYDIRKDIN